MQENEILELEEKLTQGDSSQEIDTRYIFEEFLNDDALIVGPKGELYNKEFIVKAHGPQRTLFEKVSVDEIKVRVFSDSAHVYSLNTYHMKSKSFQLRFLRVWKKQDNRWQVFGGSTTIVP